MSLQAALNLFLQEYPTARMLPFKGNSVGSFIRHDLPEVIAANINNNRYKVKGSVGQSKWARVPWVAVFDTLVTDSAQDGYYIVYLVKEDFSGIFLSLNQGVTTIRERYHSDAKRALRARAKDFEARLGVIPEEFKFGKIDLAVESTSSLGADYEVGAICSKFYDGRRIPNDETLWNDLDQILDLYLLLVERDAPPSRAIEREDDEEHFEDTTKIRIHKRIERNQRLSKKVKKLKGYTCEVCGFSYQDLYKEIGDEFIEAHHLVPLSELKKKKVKMDPEKDFAVLCANCHRMIHRTSSVHNVQEFTTRYLK